MNGAVDPSLRNLNDCGCCEGLSVRTPVQVYNRPGLTAVAYRVGTHPQFKQTLLARLSASRHAALQDLNTRDDDDFSIALLDAWAMVADVLTFYQERIANEAYLRTARERLSVLEMVRLIDYELRPGVAAGTYLAFTLEEAPGALGLALSLGTTAQRTPAPSPPITIDRGTKVQSIPGPGEEAQTFETVEPIEASAEWNAIKPRLTQPQTLSIRMGSVMLQGTATNLQPGDTVLIAASPTSRVTKRILTVTPDDAAKTTRVDFDTPALSPAAFVDPSPVEGEGRVSEFSTRVALGDSVGQRIIARTWRAEDLSGLAKMQNWPVEGLVTSIARQAALRDAPGKHRCLRVSPARRHFRPQCTEVGLAADRPAFYEKDRTVRPGRDDRILTSDRPCFPAPGWEDRTLDADAEPSANQHSIYLDAVYPGIVKGSWLVMASPTRGARVRSARQR